jgi:hypothetical protein
MLQHVYPLLRNDSVNNAIARQQIPITHQWTNWKVMFSMTSVRQLRDATMLETVFSMYSAPRLYYLHRDPASRRRRRKGKSQM